VGDPNQLPPTVLSQAAGAACLSQSLFERLQKAGAHVNLLDLQYRMHPAISRWVTTACCCIPACCCNVTLGVSKWWWVREGRELLVGMNARRLVEQVL
jgi:hypothetical protein